jgi:hypothetical protein
MKPIALAFLALLAAHSLPTFAADGGDPYGVKAKSEQESEASEKAEEAAQQRQLMADMEHTAEKKGGAPVKKGSVVEASCDGQGLGIGPDILLPAYTCIQLCLTNHKGCQVNQYKHGYIDADCETVSACK